jgi:molybdate transport system ATP-binding protein
VTDLMDESEAQQIVRLDVSGVPLLSRITRKSAAGLGLEPGKQVYAQVKSVALLA